MTVLTTPTFSATRFDVLDTARVLHSWIRRTPLVEWSDPANGRREALLKLELLQHSGSFKVRGAFANLLLRQVPREGVVAASGGNHGAAVAYAAQRLGVPAVIFVPTIASPAKVDRIRSYGATLIVTGDSYADALAASQAWGAGRDVLPVHAFDQIETILGQGTLGFELDTQVPDADTVLVPVGGGGLLAGLAAWYGRSVRLIGVEPASAATLSRALEAGCPVDVAGSGIAADSLAPRSVGTLAFDVFRPAVEAALVVSDEEIRAAQQFLWEQLRIVAEPGGATAFAALHSEAYTPREGERVVVAITGGNTTAVSFHPLTGAA